MAITNAMGIGPTTITPTVKATSLSSACRRRDMAMPPAKVGNNYAPASASTPLFRIKKRAVARRARRRRPRPRKFNNTRITINTPIEGYAFGEHRLVTAVDGGLAICNLAGVLCS